MKEVSNEGRNEWLNELRKEGRNEGKKNTGCIRKGNEKSMHG